MKTVEICGGIATGKTTFAYLLRNIGFHPVLERFEDNPFFEMFYQEPQMVAFETEVTFALQHFSSIKRQKSLTKIICSDFSPFLDLAYARVTLCDTHLDVFETVMRQIRMEIGPPDLLIRLICPSRIAHQRICRRGRPAELGIEIEYLDKIEASLSRVLAEDHQEGKTVVIDSSKLNFADVSEDRKSAMAIVQQLLG